MAIGGAANARRRADEAAARALRIRLHLEAVEAGDEQLHGATSQELVEAQDRTVAARHRLQHALESSAAAHERAAQGHEQIAAQTRDFDGVHAARAAVHRHEAQQARRRAADMAAGKEPTQ